MGIHRGPNTVKDDLVFGYDTGYGVADNSTATRFYPGEPATNNSILAGYTWAGDGGNQSFANKGATAITDNSLKYNGYDTVLWTPGGSLNCYLNGTGDFNYSDGSTVWTFSCYVKREDGAAITSLNVYMYYPSSDGNAAGTIVDCGNGWYRVSRTRTGGTSAIQLAGFTGFSSGNKYYLSGVMLSKTSHTVPYVAVQSARSSTASLIDLKRTTNIDVDNVSFDSTGQPDYDGTNDYIVASPSNISLGTNLTMEVWIYPTGYNHSRMYLMDPRGDGNTSGTNAYFLFDYHQSPDTVHVVAGNSNIEVQSSNFSMPLNNWHNIVATRNGNSWVIYHNGVSVGTGTTNTTSLTLNNDFRIGTFASGSSGQYFFEGLMAVAKIYNTGLSASEVTQNYKAYKNRFDI